MKRSLVIVITALAFLVNSCSNDLDITADWKEVTVVYGLLDPSQNVQYIRINKAFLDENTSALVLAKESDSLFHQDSISVILEEVETGVQIKMQKVNADTIPGMSKNSGLFGSDKNILYRTFTPIKQNNTYKLIITNTRTGAVVTSETSIVKDFTVNKPTSSFPVFFASETPVSVEFAQPVNADIYDLSIRINYREVVKGSTENEFVNPSDVLLDTFIVWNIFQGKSSSDLKGNCGGLCYKIIGAEFYTFLAKNIPVNPNVDRIADSVDFIFNVGGDDLAKYIAVSQAQGNSITQTQSSSPYTNITGGVGVFSSRYTKEIKNVPLILNNQFTTIDKLACDSATRKLRFLTVSNVVNKTVYYKSCP